ILSPGRARCRKPRSPTSRPGSSTAPSKTSEHRGTAVTAGAVAPNGRGQRMPASPTFRFEPQPYPRETMTMTRYDRKLNVTAMLALGLCTSAATLALAEDEADAAVAYIRSNVGPPWGQNTNEQAMDLVFG